MLQTKFQDAEKYLNQVMYGREREIRILFQAMLSSDRVGYGANCMFIGAPGSGKSYMTKKFAQIFENDIVQGAKSFFEVLCSKFLKPADVFGPEDFKKLTEEKIIVRVTENFAPNSLICFLDEIWKAHAVLNTLLRLTNEREFSQNGIYSPVPTIMFVGASNEEATDGELNALKDRFLFNCFVEYIQDKTQKLEYLKGFQKKVPEVKIKISEVLQAHEEVRNVVVTDDTVLKLLEVAETLANSESGGIVISDRRLKQVIPVIQANAWWEGRTETCPEDVAAVSPCLWSSLKDQKMVELVVRKLCNAQLDDLLTRYDLIMDSFIAFKNDGPNGDARSLALKLKDQIAEIEAMNISAKNAMEKAKVVKAAKAIHEALLPIALRQQQLAIAKK